MTKAWRKFWRAEKAEDKNMTMTCLKDMYWLEECYMLTDEVIEELEAQKDE